MKKLILFLLTTSLLYACKEAPKTETAAVKGKSLLTLPINPEKAKGMYAGEFKETPISLVLNYVSHRHASGYNVHKGLMRNLSGTIEFANGKLHLQLSEPGNNPYDGKFDLLLDTATWNGTGQWKPMKKGKETSFSFRKRILKEGEPDFDQIYMDSLSNYITLKPDGSCTYVYTTDSTSTAQQNTVRGSYQQEKGTVTIYWQKNDIFPSGKSVFKMSKEKPFPEEDYTLESLKGEGKVFSEMMF